MLFHSTGYFLKNRTDISFTATPPHTKLDKDGEFRCGDVDGHYCLPFFDYIAHPLAFFCGM